MNKVQRAVDEFKKGLNCSQAIVAAYGPAVGLPRQAAVKVAAAFGGGMGRTGRICGAITGAMMVLGLHCGRDGDSISALKKNSCDLAREFLSRFEDRNGSIDCCDLLGVNISTPEGVKRAKKAGVFKKRCPHFVQDAAEILEELLNSKAN